MKRILCALLCLLLCAASIPFAAAEAPGADADGLPVILLPGLCENALIRDKGEKTESQIWFPVKAVLRGLLRHTGELLVDIVKQDTDALADLAVDFVCEVAEPIRMNPDGSSCYNVSPIVEKAEDCSYNALKKSGKLAAVTYGTTTLKAVADEIGGDRAFVFQYDWRMSPFGIAEDLHDFIGDVKSLTGSDRVNISGTSFGSEILATYLYLYGEEGDLHRVLMNSPAYAGSALFREMLSAEEPPCIDYEDAMNNLLVNYGVELELGYLLKLLPEGAADKVVHEVVNRFIKQYYLPSVSFWGVCPHADYEEMKALLLDPEENAEMIAEADRVQYEIVANIREILQGAEDFGTQVCIIMNEGCRLLTSRGSGDLLVDAANGTGGNCLGLGEHFADDYTPERVVCTDETHDHVSYTGSLDLTNGYLPESTWVFYGQMHGQNYWDANARPLTLKLLTTDEITDVYSDPAFPQFRENAMTVSDVLIELKDRPATVVSPADGPVTATVRNLSHIFPQRIRSITVDGLPCEIDTDAMLLLPGMSREITVTPTGEGCKKYGSITIEYDELFNLKPHKSRTQYFAIR
ncbi:MAG: hypothetical protein IJL26_00425 [Clostridia bacterium]|nr:hypothetical protein [Clostridia bacterium]